MGNPLQAGVGYGFNASGFGFSLNTTPPFPQEFEAPMHPFQVYLAEIDGEEYKVSVVPGMLNNLDPQAFDTAELLTDTPPPKGTLAFDGNGISWVYLRSGPEPEVEGEEPLYPDPDPVADGYPMVVISSTQLTDTDEEGYILLARAELLTPEGGGTAYVEFTQYVRGSLWGERFKCGDATAVYWFAGV